MIEVVYEDHHLLAVNKPAPLLTQAPPGVPNLEALAKAYLKEKYQKPAGVYLGVPHRLDRPVTGVVVFARNSKAASRVHGQFHDRTVRKVYWALLDGDLSLPEGGETWVDWIKKRADEAVADRAAEGEPGAKRAELTVRVLTRGDGVTAVEFTPLTGRMHQLRVQAAWRGHPVRGDAQYGSAAGFGPAVTEERERVIALHARRLVLTHPFTKAELVLVAPVPGTWPPSLVPADDSPGGPAPADTP